MKLLIQSDDYGITKAQALGCIEGIKNGIVRNTGMFTNMPWAKEVAEWIRPYMDRIALGVDLNASTGPSLTKLKSLVQDDGFTFKTSKQNRTLDTDDNNHDHVVYEDVYAEFEAQIKKFIELFGKKPDYLHGHAYGTKTTIKASVDLARKYGIPYSAQVQQHEKMHAVGMPWYKFPPTLDNQRDSDLTKYIVSDEGGFLTSGKEYGMLICHTGYVESCLFDLSSFNVYRCKDLEGCTSKETLKWVKDHNIELITYKDVYDWLKDFKEGEYPNFTL